MQVALWGLRGGVGTTSVAAMLGDALSRLGESVLLVDLNPSSMLRLHFNVPFSDDHGWVRCMGAAGAPRRLEMYRVKENLSVAPYGRLDANMPKSAELAEQGDAFWFELLPRIRKDYSWVIFDMPQCSGSYARVRDASALKLMVVPPDMAGRVLLSQYSIGPDIKMVVNGLQSAYRLSDDILLDLRRQYRGQMSPVVIRHDQNIHQALAHKMPATTYYPGSVGAADATSLAVWCMVNRGPGNG